MRLTVFQPFIFFAGAFIVRAEREVDSINAREKAGKLHELSTWGVRSAT
jgi:hypothetical protein